MRRLVLLLRGPLRVLRDRLGRPPLIQLVHSIIQAGEEGFVTLDWDAAEGRPELGRHLLFVAQILATTAQQNHQILSKDPLDCCTPKIDTHQLKF